MAKRTRTSAGSGSSRRKRGAADSSRSTFTGSEPPSGASKPHYRRPRTAGEFAAQANDVCTRLLNGEISRETAKTYSSIARVVSQTISAQVTSARFLKQAPDLSLGSNVYEDEKDPKP